MTMATVERAASPDRETDCSRILGRLRVIAKRLEDNVTRMRGSTEALYPHTPDDRPEVEKREQGLVGEIDGAIDLIESLASEFTTELDRLNRFVG